MADENKLLAGKAGAIDAVVAAMRAHVGNAGVSGHACRALWNICLNGALGVCCVYVCVYVFVLSEMTYCW